MYLVPNFTPYALSVVSAVCNENSPYTPTASVTSTLPPRYPIKSVVESPPSAAVTIGPPDTYQFSPSQPICASVVVPV